MSGVFKRYSPSPAPAPRQVVAVPPWAGGGARGDRMVLDRSTPFVEKKPRGGGAYAVEVDRAPNGVLMRLEGASYSGYFDQDGYWCKHVGDRQYVVYRSAPRHIMVKLTAHQKKSLRLARARAKKAGRR